jgi:hypothetical protein
MEQGLYMYFNLQNIWLYVADTHAMGLAPFARKCQLFYFVVARRKKKPKEPQTSSIGVVRVTWKTVPRPVLKTVLAIDLHQNQPEPASNLD